MDFMETIIFVVSLIVGLLSIIKWVQLFSYWPEERSKPGIHAFGGLFSVVFIFVALTLRDLASFDVVDNIIYIMFYIAIGYAWLTLGLWAMIYFFDLSWVDDAICANNKAAIFSIPIGALGLVLIYCGANIGDGPGWWCVIFAGGLGFVVWILLGLIIHVFTDIFERITVGRDLGCGIRTGLYFLAAGIILGRASAGNWTSFFMTIVEFLAGWPVLILTVFMILIERYYLHKEKRELNGIVYQAETNTSIASSVCWGIVYVFSAVISVILLPPLP